MITETIYGHQVPFTSGVVTYTSGTTLALSDQNVLVDLSAAGAGVDIVLPEVAAAAGRVYAIALAPAPAYALTVQSNSIDLEHPDTILYSTLKCYYLVLSAGYDHLVLFSTGRNWVVLDSYIAP